MAKNYVLQFGNTLWTGLSPTFLHFNLVPAGGATLPPGITEVPTTLGLYYFTYEPLSSIAFYIDGGSALGNAGRYIVGNLDPVDAIDERITELGSTVTAIGNSLGALSSSFAAFGSSVGNLQGLIGSPSDSFGSTAADPSTIFGYVKRLQEFNEGDSTFTKSSGVWNIYARGNVAGASTELIQKTITDSGSVITKV